jgi:two-component system, cell cycle sensor histidine kinase and response regulator CckA
VKQSDGYITLESESGRGTTLHRAKKRWRSLARTRVIHLVATDVIMPGMSGRVLWDRLRALRPDARVLFMSGYTDDTIAWHGVLERGIAFLQKPFTPHTLGEKVREVLDTGPGLGA